MSRRGNNIEPPVRMRDSTASFEMRNGAGQSRTPVSETNSEGSSAIEGLDFETQKALLRTFELFYEQESETMLDALEESRDEIKNSMLELCNEQERYKEELVKASEGKYTFKRKKENSIPLSEYLRRKRGLDSRMTSAAPYSPSDGQHPSDREAVETYLRRRERQAIAESNRKNHEINEQVLEAETQKILNNIQGIDLNIAKDRDRQMEKIQMKLKGTNKQTKDDQQVANEIIGDYRDSKSAFEREKRAQQEKFQARLNVAREKRAVSPIGRDLSNSDFNSFQSREVNDISNSTSRHLAVGSRNVPLVDI